MNEIKPGIYDNIWAFEYNRILGYFLGIGAVSSPEGLSLPGCTVSLTELQPKTTGPLKFPQTRVVIQGDNAEAVYKSFQLNFLSGGA